MKPGLSDSRICFMSFGVLFHYYHGQKRDHTEADVLERWLRVLSADQQTTGRESIQTMSPFIFCYGLG